MTELLFVLMAAFVAYVAHTVYNSPHDKGNSQSAPPSPETIPDLSATKAASANAIIDQEVVIPADVPAQKLSNSKPVMPAKAIKAKTPTTPTTSKAKAPTPTIAKASVRNPLSGEVSSITNNYRFTKRWVKDALVTEGLLAQVYKNNEITSENETLIKQAMTQLAAMAKYKA